MNNSQKGSAKLANILQGRMNNTSQRTVGVTVERGEVVSGHRLKISSVPGATLDKGDYTVCATIRRSLPCQGSSPINAGDKVLVLWTYDGEPVIIDKIVEANMPGANPSCGWNKTCPKVNALEKTIGDLQSEVNTQKTQISTMQNEINGYKQQIQTLNQSIEKLEKRIEEL